MEIAPDRQILSADMGRNLLRAAKLCAVTLVSLVALFIILQTLALGLTSDAVIIRALERAIATRILTGESFPRSPYGDTNLDYDMFTECIAFTTNLGNEDRSLLERVAETSHREFRDDPDLSPCKTLIAELKDPVTPRTPYFRYWHGHIIVLRPLLSVMSLAKVHTLTAMALIASVIALALALMPIFGRHGVAITVFSLLAGTNILTTPAVVTHALTWIVAFLSIAWAARALEHKNPEDPRFITFVFGSGCVAVFFDSLISPSFAPTFIAFLTIAAVLPRRTVARALFAGALLAGAWFAGFILAWIAKWLFAAAVLGWSRVFADITSAVGIRTFGSAELGDRGLFSATMAAFNAKNGTLIGVSLLVAAVWAGLAIWRREGIAPWRNAALLAPLVIPIAWVEVARDHSLVHPVFAARSFVLFAIIPLLAALILWRGRRAPA